MIESLTHMPHTRKRCGWLQPLTSSTVVDLPDVLINDFNDHKQYFLTRLHLF